MHRREDTREKAAAKGVALCEKGLKSRVLVSSQEESLYSRGTTSNFTEKPDQVLLQKPPSRVMQLIKEIRL